MTEVSSSGQALAAWKDLNALDLDDQGRVPCDITHTNPEVIRAVLLEGSPYLQYICMSFLRHNTHKTPR